MRSLHNNIIVTRTTSILSVPVLETRDIELSVLYVIVLCVSFSVSYPRAPPKCFAGSVFTERRLIITANK